MRRVLIGVAGAVVAGLGLTAIAHDGGGSNALVSVAGAQTPAKSWQVTRDKADERLYGIAATGAKNAWATGFTFTTKVRRALVLHWNGKAWSPTELPAAVQDSAVFDVKAVSPSNAWAFALNGVQTFVLHWNGKKWALSGSWTSAEAMPGRVIALSPTNVWSFSATAPTITNPLPKADAHHFDGKSWRAASVPQAIIGADGPAKNAWAVGWTSTGLPYPAVSHWNGSRWIKAKLPKLGPGALISVLARSTKDVWAVGTSGGKGLILHWDGKHWKRITTSAVSLESVADDGANGLWLTANDGRALHYQNGHFSWATLPAEGTGLTTRILVAARVPNTKTLWATGIVHKGSNPQDGLLLEYGR